MKFKFFIILIAIALIFSGLAFAAQDSPKIGIINLQKVLRESKAGQKARTAFEKELEGKRTVLQNKEKGLRQLETELKSKGAQLKPGERKAKEETYEKDLKELRRLKTDFEEELKKKDAELTSGLVKDIFEITKKIGDEKKYTVILQAGPQIMYLDKTADLTGEVLRRYDSQYTR